MVSAAELEVLSSAAEDSIEREAALSSVGDGNEEKKKSMALLVFSSLLGESFEIQKCFLFWGFPLAGWLAGWPAF